MWIIAFLIAILYAFANQSRVAYWIAAVCAIPAAINVVVFALVFAGVLQ